jgi:hypothetical protein
LSNTFLSIKGRNNSSASIGLHNLVIYESVYHSCWDYRIIIKFWFPTKVYIIHVRSISNDKLTIYYFNCKTNTTNKLWNLYLKLCVFIIYFIRYQLFCYSLIDNLF